MSKSDLSEKEKILQNKEDYFVINKKQLVDNFFVGVLILGLIIFLVLLGRGIYGSLTGKTEKLNPDLISYYADEYLNITYPVPGGSWGQGEIDKTGLAEIISASSGDDGLFQIGKDTLTEEIISSIYFLEDGDEGFRQFMSFSFKPVQNTVTKEDFLNYCIDSFNRDIENSGDYVDFTITESYVDDLGGALLRGVLTEEYTSEDSEESQILKSYYTQYILPLGANIGTVTYGSLIEDNTADEYMRYYLNNIIDINASDLPSTDITTNTELGDEITLPSVEDTNGVESNDVVESDKDEELDTSSVLTEESTKEIKE